MVGCREGQWERFMTLLIDSVHPSPTGVSLYPALSEAGVRETDHREGQREQLLTGRAWQAAE